ncbi:MAG: T9SS type A sorting domain-containing protein [Ignavibacteria bacterium]|nr:T9SS type A sorting domain-containing protein [Ignavibacteria bacterium]
MIKLKSKNICLYLLNIEIMEQMSYRNIFTKFIISILIFFIYNLPNYSQIQEYYYPLFYEKGFNFPLPYHSDSCLYFPETIFTTGTIPIGIKIAQPEIKKIPRRNNGKYNDIRTDYDTTSSKGNKILSIRETEKGDKMAVYLQIENMDKNINIVIYNLLGKKVLDVYDGKPKDPSQPYEFSTNELPKGIFLLVVFGENFRLREKLVIAK